MHGSRTTTVVLVEGISDHVAVTTLASNHGHDLPALGVDIVPMGGATNIGNHLRRYDDRARFRVAGLCDVGESGHYRRALERAGLGAGLDQRSMEGLGFFVCARDLEDELIRALGPDLVQDVAAAEGDLAAFRTFQRQPAQRQKPVQDQLRRFLGTTSGRKAHYARALVEALPSGAAPRPLAGLLAWL